jgi:hypothetical protein
MRSSKNPRSRLVLVVAGLALGSIALATAYYAAVPVSMPESLLWLAALLGASAASLGAVLVVGRKDRATAEGGDDAHGDGSDQSLAPRSRSVSSDSATASKPGRSLGVLGCSVAILLFSCSLLWAALWYWPG